MSVGVCISLCRVSGHLAGGCLGSWRALPLFCCLFDFMILDMLNILGSGLFTCFTCNMGIAPIREPCTDFQFLILIVKKICFLKLRLLKFRQEDSPFKVPLRSAFSMLRQEDTPSQPLSRRSRKIYSRERLPRVLLSNLVRYSFP